MNLDYFVKKFSDLPSEYFSLSTDSNPTDVWEWCTEEESKALRRIVKPFGILLCANDGDDEYSLLGRTPKERILNFLEYIRVERGPDKWYLWS